MPDRIINALPDGLFEKLVTVRRAIHGYPELSFHEHRTGDRIAAELEELGLEPIRAVAGTGVIADVGSDIGPKVAIRADLDALPIKEKTGLDFASEVSGVMHACGHDGHATMLLGAAALLAAKPPERGQVRLIFQPAEERGNGALHVCNEGHLAGVEAIFGLHLDPRWPAGTIVASPGPASAASRSFIIDVLGKGGHAARPHQGIDAVVVGSAIVQALQSIVSRQVRPGEPAVVTVGRFDAGTGRNSLAERAHLEGTIRCFDNRLSLKLRDLVRRTVLGVADAHGAKLDLSFGEGCPAVINDEAVTDVALGAARRVLGAERVLPLDHPNTGAEDFSFYARCAPGCHVRLGSQLRSGELIPTHSDRFDFDERALAVGARWFEAAARDALDALVDGRLGDGGDK
jgi:amidohydrolase